jgi:UTP--glucose-1-phosphate uridylyltransferase
MDKNNRIRTAVFPVAGLGTRFLPVTKSVPKEMLPLVDKPLIQYVVEEAVAAGMTQLIFISNHEKYAIENYFDRNFELEYQLAQAGKIELLEKVRYILPEHVQCIYIRQFEPLGLGHAVLCAKNVVKNEPFAVLLPDDIVDYSDQETNCLKEMIKIFHENHASVLAVEQVPQSQTQNYGIVSLKSDSALGTMVGDIIEKPSAKTAPSRLAVIGRYVFTPAIFTDLESVKQGVGNEIQLTDGIKSLLRKEAVYAYTIAGTRYDCGSQDGFLRATYAYAEKNKKTAGYAEQTGDQDG